MSSVQKQAQMKNVVALLAAAGAVLGGPVVDLGHAQYEGFVDGHNITNFLGIRYAVAPIGNLRWQAPAPPPSVPGIQQTTAQPAKCYQSPPGNSSAPNPVLTRRDIEESEDCLFLKYALLLPAQSATNIAQRVFSFIGADQAAPHSGLDLWWRSVDDAMCRTRLIFRPGYALGAASDYNGTELVLESNKNIVVVILQDRLGLFGGFLFPTAGSKAQCNQDSSLETKFMKTVLPTPGCVRNFYGPSGLANSLQWTKILPCDGSTRTLESLGKPRLLRRLHDDLKSCRGDPEHVTIWRQSAGAGSVIQHVLTHSGKTSPQLFRSAMTSSTCIPPQYAYNHWVPQAAFDEVAELAGRPNSTTLACLRDADAGTLQTVNIDMSVASYLGTLTFAPVVDGSFIVENPIAQLSQGKVNGQAYYAVTNTNEGVLFVDGDDVSNATAYARDVPPVLTLQQDAKVAQIYASLRSPLEQAQAIVKELDFVCPSFYALAAFPGKSYKAQFAIPPALHGDDVSYYFPSFDAFGTPTPRFNNTDFINAFVSGFLSFAVNGNPNDKLAPTIAPT
uniref:Carboxylesterase type B domain-containing protein n=1 Tax=Mycena chlorophos TaxID=658473 RepID=A0ABQ0L663_MYCCL|nr:predicted protein [Mycena chlorophos]